MEQTDIICPQCKSVMVKANFGVTVDVCKNGCKGIWFEQGELTRLDDTDEGIGPALSAALQQTPHGKPPERPLTCPRCSIKMHTHKYKRAKEVTVDECYNCGAFFLEAGELAEIRNNHMSDAEVAAYADQLANTVPEYLLEESNLEIQKRRPVAIKKFARVIKGL